MVGNRSGKQGSPSVVGASRRRRRSRGRGRRGRRGGNSRSNGGEATSERTERRGGGDTGGGEGASRKGGREPSRHDGRVMLVQTAVGSVARSRGQSQSERQDWRRAGVIPEESSRMEGEQLGRTHGGTERNLSVYPEKQL